MNKWRKWYMAGLGLASLVALSVTGCGEVNNARDAAKKSGLKFGFAASVENLTRETDRKIIAENSSILVAENCTKFANIHPTMRIWNWADADNFFAFNAENKIDTKFHVFVWHIENPAFVKKLKTKDEALEVMDAHIEGIMNRYKDKIACCDVSDYVVETPNPRRCLRKTALFAKQCG